jgi:DNA repair protein RadC
MLHLNTKQRLIGMHRIVGSTDRVALSIPELLLVALLSNGRMLVFAHNHLSGDPEPSGDVRELVQRLRNAVRIVELELLDAVIVVDPTLGEQYFSFRTSGLL